MSGKNYTQKGVSTAENTDVVEEKLGESDRVVDEHCHEINGHDISKCQGREKLTPEERERGRSPTYAFWICHNCGHETVWFENFEAEECPETPEKKLIADGGEVEPRTRRAREEDMDVTLKQKGGIYEVHSQSGNTYEVDVAGKTCSCPDWEEREPEGGCKHMRRVDMEIRSGDVPKPDGSIPEVALADGGAEASVRAKIEEAIEERESEIAELEAEVRELRFVLDTMESVESGDGLPEMVVEAVEEGSE